MKGETKQKKNNKQKRMMACGELCNARNNRNYGQIFDLYVTVCVCVCTNVWYTNLANA